MTPRKRERLVAYQASLIEKQTLEVENMYRKMRAWRHDYHNHIQALSVLLAENRVEDARAFLDKIDHDLVSTDRLYRTGNTMVDAILGSKLSLMASEDIPADVTARVPAKVTVSDVDLSIVIGNLLDNAIEACRRLPAADRFVRVYIAPKKGTHLYLCITNAAGKKQNRVGTGFSSLKGKAGGLGLWSVDRLVEKYGGYLTRASEDGGFTTEVILPR